MKDNIVPFKRPLKRKKKSANKVKHSRWHRFGRWLASRACASFACILETLHPFILIAYWIGVITGVTGMAAVWFLLTPPQVYEQFAITAVIFLGALVMRYGSEHLSRKLRAMETRIKDSALNEQAPPRTSWH